MNWMPIESAPKDGTPILGFADGFQTTVLWVGYWSLVMAGTYCDYDEFCPSHWQPLPPPPAE